MATTTLSPLNVKGLPQNADKRGSVAEAAGSHESVLEPKYDGWRTLWHVDAEGKARFYTRTGNELTGAMPAVEAELSRVLTPGSWLDAEVVAFSLEDGKVVHHWGKVQSVLSSGTKKAALASSGLTLVVFDLLAHGGIDARGLSFSKRRGLLERLFELNDFAQCVMLTPQIEPTDDNYDTLLANGYEGGVVKWLDAPYASGIRGKGWWKIKAEDTDEAIIVGYKDGQGSFEGLVGAVEFAQYDTDGVLVHRGRCSGMDYAVRKAISGDREGHLGRVFEFKYLMKMPSGAYRSPNFKRFRPDKSAEVCVG